MKLYLVVSDKITGQGHHQVIVVDDWSAAMDRGREESKKWAAAHRINVDDVDVSFIPADSK